MDGQLEFATKVFELDENLQAAVDRLAADGWMLVPNVKPSVIYQVCRQASQEKLAAIGGFGRFTIDESKIGILRNGKFVDNDGNEVPPPG